MDNIKKFKKIRVLKNNTYYLKIDDYKEFCKLGFSEVNMGSLFDENGMLIEDKIFPFNLYKYDN